MKRSIFFIFALFLFVLISTNIHAQSSGLLIGVNVFETDSGLQVVSTIPNTPAEGKIYPYDILRFMTADGRHVYSAQRLDHFEKAKRAIGADREAFLEILRNGKSMCFKVSFLSILPITMSYYASAETRSKITPASESEAGRLFADDCQESCDTPKADGISADGDCSQLFAHPVESKIEKTLETANSTAVSVLSLV